MNIATSAATSTAIPARISRGLSRNGRRRSAEGLRPGPVERLGVIDVTVAGINRASFFQIEQIVQLTHELADVTEVAINGRKPDIRDFVQLLQLFHDERTDFRRRNFLFR